MFKCGVLGVDSKPGEKVNRIVVKKREKEYWGEVYNEDTDTYDRAIVGRGWEVEKEIIATDAGLALWNKTQASLRPDEK